MKGHYPWKYYCERGIDMCLSTSCPCVNSFFYRWRCARAKGRGWWDSLLYTFYLARYKK